MSDFQQPAEGFRPAPPAGGDFAPRPPGPFGGPGGPGMGPGGPGMGGPPRPGGGGFRGRPKGKYTPRRICTPRRMNWNTLSLMRARMQSGGVQR